LEFVITFGTIDDPFLKIKKNAKNTSFPEFQEWHFGQTLNFIMLSG
jgi:hypothetical protein